MAHWLLPTGYSHEMSCCRWFSWSDGFPQSSTAVAPDRDVLPWQSHTTVAALEQQPAEHGRHEAKNDSREAIVESRYGATHSGACLGRRFGQYPHQFEVESDESGAEMEAEMEAEAVSVSDPGSGPG
ncbi:hypothetical protein E4U53_002743 [Claviceps sorghi]|nr:hypothetical protein E4U53_002743 [Claviceps sorghi]